MSGPLRGLVAGVLLVTALGAIATECRKTASTCIDTAASKAFSGVTVTLDQVGGCWKYQDTYECIKPNAVNYCAGLEVLSAQGVCAQTGASITAEDFNGAPMVQTDTFRCGNASMAAPENTTKLASSYTLASNTVDASQCAANDANAKCAVAANVDEEGNSDEGFTCISPDNTWMPTTRYFTSGTNQEVPAGTPNAVPVTKYCWELSKAYACVVDSHVDYCATIKGTAGCSQVGQPVCKAYAWDSSCMDYQRDYYCGTARPSDTSNLFVLSTAYSLKSDTITSTCGAEVSNPNCGLASHTCIEGQNETRTIGGLNVTKDCWKWEDSYTCADTTLSSDCQELVDRGCTEAQPQTCKYPGATAAPGECTLYEHVYSCVATPATTHTVRDCSTSLSCMNTALDSSQCFQTSSPPDQDYMAAVAAMEAARQGGTYFDGTLFRGVDERCAKGYAGLKNCCKTNGGAKTNSSVFPVLAVEGIMLAGSYAANQVARAASPYVYDAMFQSSFPSLVEMAEEAWATNAWSGSSWDPNVSAYGFALAGDSGAASGLLGSVFGDSITDATVTLIEAEGAMPGLYFNPYAFAAQVALQVIMELMSCTQDEQALGLHRGANLCQSTGSYCSTEIDLLVGSICVETTETYCCFNSHLARIIQQQARSQIGKGWGSAESPDCSGFTPDQFASLDFSRIDLTEFINEIRPAAVDPAVVADAGKTRAQTVLQQQTSSP